MTPDPRLDLPALLAEESFLRALARALVAVEADEVVQQTWLLALQHGGEIQEPRSWLGRIARNVAANLRRANFRRGARERAAAVPERAPSSAELMLREERRAALVRAVDQLPPPVREVVLLRWFEGLQPRRIAVVLGVPVTTVWNRLRTALQLLRSQLDAEHGDDRRAWLLPLVSFVGRPPAVPMAKVSPERLPTTSAMLTGAIAMMTKGKIVAVAAVLIAAGAWVLWPNDGEPRVGPRQGSSAGAPVAAQSELDRQAIAELKPDATQREAVATPGTTGRGDLVVRLLYGDDRSPAADVMVTAFRKNEIPRNASAPSVDSKRQRTDAQGIARFPSMRAGRTGLIADRGHWFENAHVTAGKETEVEFLMPVGVTITGIVVSATGAPVAGANVELESSVVATTDEQGRFGVRGAEEHYSIGARAVGHGASKAQKLIPHDGKAEVRIELGATGGIVEGIALDPDGKSLASVRVEIGRYEGGYSFVRDDPPRPAFPRTDAEGRFRAIGIPLGEQPLSARARGMLPWSGKCQVTTEVPAAVTIVFVRGNTLRGTLRDADGHPFGDVLVSARTGELDWDEVINPDGSFEIEGLPAGEIEVRVAAEGAGEASARVQVVPGAVTKCELMLAYGLVVKGRVRDELGRPLPHVYVRLMSAPRLNGGAFTDEDGAFRIANVPEGKLALSIDGESIKSAHFEDLDPHGGELDLRAQRRAPKTVYIAGTVLDHEGRPAAARVWAGGEDSSGFVERVADSSGYFEIGPLSPGNWHVSVETRSYPRMSFLGRELSADTRWDLGTVRLAIGGDVRVEVVEGIAEAAWFSIRDGQQRGFALSVRQGKGTSDPLPVGSYRLFVEGKTQAAQSLPFEIRAGETTKIDVRVRPGVHQRFDISVPAKMEAPWGSLRILRGPDVVANTWADPEEGKPCTAEACLEPGDYTVVAKFGELEGSAAFTVGEREGEAVRIAVQPQRK